VCCAGVLDVNTAIGERQMLLVWMVADEVDTAAAAAVGRGDLILAVRM